MATLLALLLPARAWAAPGNELERPAPEEYDLQRCINTALARNPSLRMAAAGIDEAKADMKQARGSNDPRVTVTGGVTVFQSDPSFIMPGFGELVYGRKLNPEAALQVELPLFTGGQYDAYKDVARAGIRAARARALRARQRVVFDAVSAYFGVLKAQDFGRVALAQQEALAAQDRAVRKMHEVGLVAKLDPLRTGAALAAAEEGVILATNREQVALAGLRAVMGLPADAEIVVVERFDDVLLPLGMEEALEEAWTQRPEVLELQAQIEQADSARRLAHNQGRPTLGLFGRADAVRSSALPRTGVFTGGLGVKWPLFDGDVQEAAEDRALAQKEQLLAALEGLRSQVAVEVTEAFLAYQAADPRVETTTRGVAAAEEGFELAAVGYANQVVPLTDMLDAQAQRAGAQNDHIMSVYDRRMAMANLIYAIGR